MRSMTANKRAGSGETPGMGNAFASPRRNLSIRSFKRTWPLYALVIPAMTTVFLFEYLPMFGLIIVFKDYKPWLGFLGSQWVGMKHFEFMFANPNTLNVIRNTFVIAALKLVFGQLVPIVFALLLNEVRVSWFKRLSQTFVYLPHFLSWVILGGILIDMLSIRGGIVNQFLGVFGIQPIFFLGSNSWFVPTLIVTHIWKEFGFSTIVYLAALSGLDMNLYDAAEVDGATRLQQTWHVTIPGIVPIIVVLATLSIGNILNAGFNQIFNLYNPLVYETGDIIDTYVYRVGLVDGAYSFAAAVGFFKAIVSFTLVATTYTLAYKFGNYRIF